MLSGSLIGVTEDQDFSYCKLPIIIYALRLILSNLSFRKGYLGRSSVGKQTALI